MKKNFYKIILLAFLNVSVAVMAGQINGIVATVGEKIITVSDFDNLLNILAFERNIPHESMAEAGFKKSALNHIVERELFLNYAASYNFTSANISDLQKNYFAVHGITHDTLVDDLKKANIPEDDFNNYLQQESIIQKTQQMYVMNKANISNDQAQQYIDSYKDKNTTFHIVDFYLPKSAGKVSSKRFSELVSDAVVDYKAGQEVHRPMYGNDLGVRSLSELPELYKKVVPDLKVNVPSYMIIADNGYHSLLLIEKNSAKEINLQDAKQRLLYIKAQDLLPKFIAELKESTYVHFN